MRLTGLSPTEFTLVFAFMALLAVVFYLLSFRRRTTQVATDPIWRRVIGRRRTPFRKLLALLLQVLLLFLLALALGDPRVEAETQAPPVAQAVVLDVSASMEAQEEGGTRLERAVQLVSAMADAVGPRDRMVLMAMDDSCRPLTDFTSDAGQLRQAAAAVKASTVAEDAPSALAFALAALKGAGLPEELQRRVVLVSDRFHDLPPAPEDTEVVQVAVGEATENLAVTAFDLRRRTGAASGTEVFLEVSNTGRGPHGVQLSIHTPTALLGDETLAVPAGGSVSRSYFLKPLAEERLLATITSPGGTGPADGFVLDDRAYALIPKRESRRVLLVTEGNLFLEKALGLNPAVDLTVVPAARFSQALLADFKAVVFDGLCPPAPIPAAYFGIGEGPGCPFALGEEVTAPKLLPLRGDNAVTEGISLVDVQIQKARRLVPEPADLELLSDDKGPLIIARERDGQKLLGVGFDVARSDLPLRVAFPMLLHNILVWFLGEALDLGFNDLTVGSPIELPAGNASDLRVTDPFGKVVVSTRVGDHRLLRPRVPGFFVATAGTRKVTYPVNFHLRGESDLIGDRHTGSDRLLWSGGPPPPQVVAGFDRSEHADPPLQWPTVLIVVAWLLLFDWVFFCFRILF